MRIEKAMYLGALLYSTVQASVPLRESDVGSTTSEKGEIDVLLDGTM
jgi:archaellum component FlaF (FlaF/FlaG flagellin family)